MKKTKIVATVSDLNCDITFIKKLCDAGVNVIRMNTAHQDFDDSLKVINNIREVSTSIAILIDTKGPEIRTECESEFIFEKNRELEIRGIEEKRKEGVLYVSYKDFVKNIPVNSDILIDDGEIKLKVIKIQKESLICVATNAGKIKGRKSLNVPGVPIDLPSLTKRDKGYIDFAIENNVDFIAHSFVRKKEDVLLIQKILDKSKSKIKIIAKIENQEGIDNLNEILDVCYGVMVARGDLGIEIPIEKLPSLQRNMVSTCVKRKKPVIIATQMLHSMIDNPRPTRAEISDIASSVRSGADAVMLSGETAYGEYPLESVKIMSKVIVEVEKEFLNGKKVKFEDVKEYGISEYLAKSAVKSTLRLPIKAIIADSMTGRTGRFISSYRGPCINYCFCYDETVKRQLALSFGIVPLSAIRVNKVNDFLGKAGSYLIKNNFLKSENLVCIIAGSFGEARGASFIEIAKLSELMNQ